MTKRIRNHKAKLKRKIDKVEYLFNIEENEDKRDDLIEELGELVNEYRKL